MAEGVLTQNHNDISVVLCGPAGMGIQTVESLLTCILKTAGYHVFAAKDYMSRIRGGVNSTEIRISSRPVRALIDRIDVLIPLDKDAVQHLRKRTSLDTLILTEKAHLGENSGPDRFNFIDISFLRIAAELGNKVYSNQVAVGVITGLLRIDLETVRNYIKRFFADKPQPS